MLLWTLVTYSFLLLGSILLYEYIAIHLSVQPLVSAWASPHFCVMTRTAMSFISKSYVDTFLFSLGLLDHRVSIYKVLNKTLKLFSKVVLSFCNPISKIGAFQLLYILANMWHFQLLLSFIQNLFQSLYWMYGDMLNLHFPGTFPTIGQASGNSRS